MRVLVVDDDVSLQRRCRSVLEAEGFEVHCESSLGSARRFLRNQKADALILDLFLPDGGGFELLDKSASLLGDVPVVGISGVYRGAASSRLLTARYPFASVLPKPLMVPELIAALQDALGASYPEGEGWSGDDVERTRLTPSGFPEVAERSAAKIPETVPSSPPRTEPSAPSFQQTFVSPLEKSAETSHGWEPVHRAGSIQPDATQIARKTDQPRSRRIVSRSRSRSMQAVPRKPLQREQWGRSGGSPAIQRRAAAPEPLSMPREPESRGNVPTALDPRRAPLQGRLDVTPLPSLLARLARASVTGSLLLRREQVKKIVYLEDGIPRAVKSNLLGECLGQVLVREGIISQDVCGRSVERLKRERRPQGEILVEMGALRASMLDTYLQAQFDLKLFEVFGWKEGLYRFRADDLPPGARMVARRDPLALCVEGVRRSFPVERVSIDLSPYMEQVMVLRSSQAELDALGLTAEEREWAGLIDERRTLGGAFSLVGGVEGCYRLFYALMCLGALSLRG